MCFPMVMAKVLRARGLKVTFPQKIEMVKVTLPDEKVVTAEGVWRVKVLKLDSEGEGYWVFVTRTEQGWRVWNERPNEIIEKRLGVPYWGAGETDARFSGLGWAGYKKDKNWAGFKDDKLKESV